MSQHIYHATATLAELGLAMSIAGIAKIIAPATVDHIARDTTAIRVAELDGSIAAASYRIGCWVTDILGKIGDHIPLICFLIELLVLAGMVFCPDAPLVSYALCGAAFIGFVIMIFYVFYNRETLAKTGEKPLVEPAD